MEGKLRIKSKDVFGVAQFINDYPGMSLAPTRSSFIVLKGVFSFRANPSDGQHITDSYELKISIPLAFPKALPTVWETGNKIPKDPEYHINHDDTLCLGSPIRILSMVSKRPALVGFAEKCIVPFLYAISYKLSHGGKFIFSELAHGDEGMIDDYCELFGVKTREQIVQTLRLIGMKPRIANKKPCPCGCGNRLGKCVFNKMVKRYRAMAPRSWFCGQANLLLKC